MIGIIHQQIHRLDGFIIVEIERVIEQQMEHIDIIFPLQRQSQPVRH